MDPIVVYTPQQILAAGLRLALSESDALIIGRICSRPSDLVSAILETQAQLALVDLTPELTFSDLADIRRRAPTCKLVLWVESISVSVAHEAKTLGVRGVLRKDLSLELTIRCLSKVIDGELWFDRELLTSLLQARTVRLSPRERQLYAAVSCGLSNKQIAGSLGISEGTVKVYFSKLFRKVGVSDRFELALFALKNQSTEQHFHSGGTLASIIVSGAPFGASAGAHSRTGD